MTRGHACPTWGVSPPPAGCRTPKLSYPPTTMGLSPTEQGGGKQGGCHESGANAGPRSRTDQGESGPCFCRWAGASGPALAQRAPVRAQFAQSAWPGVRACSPAAPRRKAGLNQPRAHQGLLASRGEPRQATQTADASVSRRAGGGGYDRCAHLPAERQHHHRVSAADSRAGVAPGPDCDRSGPRWTSRSSLSGGRPRQRGLRPRLPQHAPDATLFHGHSRSRRHRTELAHRPGPSGLARADTQNPTVMNA
jgi:hypothetical protein